MKPQILVVQGTTTRAGRLATLASLAGAAAREAGADVTLRDLSQTPLPVMRPEDPEQSQLPEVKQVRQEAASADGFVLVTAEYHGNMSGALKNWFDFLYAELAGKFAGLLAVTGGGGGEMSILSVRNAFTWCHGFTLPFHAVARPDDFDGVKLIAPGVIERVHRIGHDVVRYAPLLRSTFEQARGAGPGRASGFAGMHASH